MSANQLPRPGGGLTHGMCRDMGRHDCPDCLRNGGHHVAPSEETLPAWARPIEPLIQSRRRQCSYWSARQQEHCGDTGKVTLIPGVGHRCETHDPDLLNIRYRALVQSAERENSMTTQALTIDLSSIGHNGHCDHDAGCQNGATHVVLSASRPECVCGGCPWDSAPPASLGFLCIGHAAAEPIAQREHAEHNAELAQGPLRKVWDALLTDYPAPIPLTR